MSEQTVAQPLSHVVEKNTGDTFMVQTNAMTGEVRRADKALAVFRDAYRKSKAQVRSLNRGDHVYSVAFRSRKEDE